jgi:hypothetical protein
VKWHSHRIFVRIGQFTSAKPGLEGTRPLLRAPSDCYGSFLRMVSQVVAPP